MASAQSSQAQVLPIYMQEKKTILKYNLALDFILIDRHAAILPNKRNKSYKEDYN